MEVAQIAQAVTEGHQPMAAVRLNRRQRRPQPKAEEQMQQAAE